MNQVWMAALGGLLYSAGVGFIPGFMLRPFLWIYPKGSDRPEEILGELYSLPFRKRIAWAFQQMEVAVFEGGKQRHHDRRLRRENQQASPPSSPTVAPPQNNVEYPYDVITSSALKYEGDPFDPPGPVPPEWIDESSPLRVRGWSKHVRAQTRLARGGERDTLGGGGSPQEVRGDQL
jgi:hypothetical protein